MGGGGQDWQKCLFLSHFLPSSLVTSRYFPNSLQSILRAASQGVPRWGTLRLGTPSRNITSALPRLIPVPWGCRCQRRAPGEAPSLL